ncbi:MAG: hypothetical protein N838_30930 [Thiohalocapsa sp. PB-PSB1]|nr:MAG: hypothetical protein N838_30930 [Thiohalocapsa sp. PB-PSB1]
MVSLEAADVRKLDDLPARVRLHGAMLWRVHLLGLMDSPPMVEIDVGTENAAQVPLVKDNDVVQVLSTEGPDHPFGADRTGMELHRKAISAEGRDPRWKLDVPACPICQIEESRR